MNITFWEIVRIFGVMAVVGVILVRMVWNPPPPFDRHFWPF